MRCSPRLSNASCVCSSASPERSFYASELIRDAGTGSGAAQRELAKLEGSGLVVGRRIGHQKHYQANAASPLYSELRNIVLKRSVSRSLCAMP